jgi:hypothetical protein
MMTLQTATKTLQRLTRFYNAGFHTPLVDNALHKVLTHQIAQDEADLAQVEARLAELEERYAMSSEDFWDKYQAGRLPDEADYIEWNAFCKMQQRLQQRLNILR